ncbi:hypothetical protein CGSMWGv1400E_05377 [Gardnerella vaginalis 1400E]|uniref:Uncharacterized protein n=1 Tax=Gardnerella vaginalis 1400E TaxID=698956 RepID=I4LU79_GARVA|nr:hypothetical protein CGSMWGv1400E_05377 [Gardnerella vaginalis 1400E]
MRDKRNKCGNTCPRLFTHLVILETNSGENKQKQEKSLQFAELDKAGHRNASESKQENRGAQKLYCTHTLKRGKYQH